jgi:hypothetical protein
VAVSQSEPSVGVAAPVHFTPEMPVEPYADAGAAAAQSNAAQKVSQHVNRSASVHGVVAHSRLNGPVFSLNSGAVQRLYDAQVATHAPGADNVYPPVFAWPVPAFGSLHTAAAASSPGSRLCPVAHATAHDSSNTVFSQLDAYAALFASGSVMHAGRQHCALLHTLLSHAVAARVTSAISFCASQPVVDQSEHWSFTSQHCSMAQFASQNRLDALSFK